jgi:hypothetical protein
MADGTCNRTATKGGCGYAQPVRRSGALEGVLTGTHGVLMGTHGVLTELVLPPRAQLLWQFRPARAKLLRTSSREYPCVPVSTREYPVSTREYPVSFSGSFEPRARSSCARVGRMVLVSTSVYPARTPQSKREAGRLSNGSL